jgi:hypothetical protein
MILRQPGKKPKGIMAPDRTKLSKLARESSPTEAERELKVILIAGGSGSGFPQTAEQNDIGALAKRGIVHGIQQIGGGKGKRRGCETGGVFNAVEGSFSLGSYIPDGDIRKDAEFVNELALIPKLRLARFRQDARKGGQTTVGSRKNPGRDAHEARRIESAAQKRCHRRLAPNAARHSFKEKVAKSVKSIFIFGRHVGAAFFRIPVGARSQPAPVKPQSGG